MGHKNILKYSNRPWTDIESMNEGLIVNWNQVVQPEDSVYFLGDFTLTSKIDLVDEWLGRLNGQWRIITGNHDKGWLKKFDILKNKNKIKWVKNYVERWFHINGNKHKIIMCHFPLLTWHGSHWGEGRSSIMLHGHTHGNIQHLNQNVRRMDVGIDCNGWYPVSLENVVALNSNKPALDHHDID